MLTCVEHSGGGEGGIVWSWLGQDKTSNDVAYHVLHNLEILRRLMKGLRTRRVSSSGICVMRRVISKKKLPYLVSPR